MNGYYDLWRKGYPWEAPRHVNMVIKMPSSGKQQKWIVGTAAATPATSAIKSDAIVEIRDVAPTIYDVLGILENITHKSIR